MKKLLAIVMVVAMTLSMSVIASAAYDTTYTADITYVDGIATIVVSVDKIDATGIGVVYPEGATPKAAALAADFRTLTQSIDEYGSPLYSWSNVANTAAADGAGHTYATIQGAGYTENADGAPIEVNGPAFQFVFECAEGTEFVVVADTTANDVVADGGVIATLTAETKEEPSEEPTEAPEDTEVPPVDETDAPATDAPEDKATDAPADKATVAPTNTNAPAGSGSSNAAKTADVAPIATMITLVVLAGATLVVLKKRATN